MQNIDLIVWDLDGTKYKFHDSIRETANEVLAELIQRKMSDASLPSLSRDEILALGQKSYQQYGLNWMIFAQKFSLDPYELFSEFNISMPMETVDSEPSSAYRNHIRTTKEMGVEHIIFTHGSRAWARKVLGKIGLSGEFNEQTIFDVSHTNWILKQNGRQAYELLGQLFPFSPTSTIMVEDTVASLFGAKELGMTTVLVDRTHSLQEHPDYVDFVYPDPETFLHDFIESRQPDAGMAPHV